MNTLLNLLNNIPNKKLKELSNLLENNKKKGRESEYIRDHTNGINLKHAMEDGQIIIYRNFSNNWYVVINDDVLVMDKNLNIKDIQNYDFLLNSGYFNNYSIISYNDVPEKIKNKIQEFIKKYEVNS